MREITFFGNTNMGMIRTNNEDAFVVQNIWDEDHILAVAIDGVGGYEGGEVAAALARDNIVEYLSKYSNGERVELLKQAVIYANNVIFEERKKDLNLANMSCVLTAVLVEVKQERINMAHVGDTRLYQFADGQIHKLSHDHSLVGYREEIGELTEEEAMRHPQRNIIGRDVGSQFLEGDCNNYVETATFPLNHRSTLLLCSDGLCDMVMSMQMADVLSTDLDVEQKANALIAAANKAGGKDNVTVVLVDINFPDEDETVEVEEAEDNGIESLGDIEIVPVNEDEESDVKTDGADKTDEADKTPADAKKKDEPKAKNSHKSLVVILVLLLIIVALGMFIVGYVYSDVVKTKAAAQAVIEQPVVEEPIIQNDTTKSDTLQLQQSVEAKE
jgi:serine/threonine protein phosphatase PrpC